MKNGHEKTQKGTSNDSATSHPLPVASNGDHSSAAGLVVAADRPADVVAFEQQVVGFFVDAADLLGVPKSVAAIYGICFACPEPLSFSDIDERLDISSGSISQGLRVLKEVGALKVAGQGPAGNSLSVTRNLGEPVADATPAGNSLPGTRNVADKAGNSDEPPANAGRTTNHGLPVTSNAGASAPARITSHESRITARSTACYTPDLELRKLILRWLENRLQNELKSGQSRLKTIMASMPPSLNQPDSVLHARFESLSTWHGKAASLLPIVKGMLKLT